MRGKYKNENNFGEVVFTLIILSILALAVLKALLYAIDNGMKNCVMDGVGCVEDLKKN